MRCVNDFDCMIDAFNVQDITKKVDENKIKIKTDCWEPEKGFLSLHLFPQLITHMKSHFNQLPWNALRLKVAMKTECRMQIISPYNKWWITSTFKKCSVEYYFMVPYNTSKNSISKMAFNFNNAFRDRLRSTLLILNEFKRIN